MISHLRTPRLLENIVLIVPGEIMPNHWSGVLFGQAGCLGKLDVQCIPRDLLTAKEESIEEGIWDILFKEHLNMKLEVITI